jgi:signal transduction histidine kinase
VATMQAGPSTTTPLASLRHLLDSRIAEIAAHTAKLERDLAATLRERERLYAALRQSAATIAAFLSGGHRGAVGAMVRALHDGLALHSDRAQIEERIVGLRSRIEFLTAERRLFEDIEQVTGGRSAASLPVDMRGARLSMAAKNMFHLAADEHESMAADILDGALQRLSDAAMDAELAGRVVTWDRATASESIRRARVATAEAASALEERLARLAPVDADNPLPDAIRSLLRRSPVAPHAHVVVFGKPRRLSRDADLAAYRVVEAALDNASRHGRALHVEVVLSYSRHRVSVVIKDDGDGFDVVATEARLGRARGLGLIEMYERARIAGGRLEVRSQTGAGTEVHLTLPASPANGSAPNPRG